MEWIERISSISEQTAKQLENFMEQKNPKHRIKVQISKSA